MHILFLADNFPPETNALASRTFEHCREWVKSGHKVTVITSAPNSPKGKIFPGYKNSLWQKEDCHGIDVIRVWTYITPNEGFYKRILDYISFMISAAFFSLFIRDVQVVIGSSPQFFNACAAAIVGKIRRIPWIFELRDLWPESIKAVGAMNDSFAIKLLEKLADSLYKSASHIVVVTNAFKEFLINKGIPSSKITVITNGVDLLHFKPSNKSRALLTQLNIKDKFVVGYIGTHGMAHKLETILEAAKILQHQETNSDIVFLFLGDGACKKDLVLAKTSLSLNNVIFLDSVSKKEVKKYWSILDALIIHLRKDELFKTVIPSKLFESMGMGIPVVHGVLGESSEIVEKYQVGERFNPEDSEELAALILKLYNNPRLLKEFSINSISAAKNFDRQVLAAKMLSVIVRLQKNELKT